MKVTVLKLGQTLKTLIKTLNDNFTELSNKLTYKPVSYKVLFTGTAAIPSKSSGGNKVVTLNDNITKFDGVYIIREGSGAWQSIDTLTVGKKLKVLNTESDFDLMEGCNLYMCNAEITATNKIKFTNNVYSGIKTNGGGRYVTSFEDRPVTKIIGIKLN